MPAPYFPRYKCVWIDDISGLSKRQWESFIDTAYLVVASSFPRRPGNGSDYDYISSACDVKISEDWSASLIDKA